MNDNDILAVHIHLNPDERSTYYGIKTLDCSEFEQIGDLQALRLIKKGIGVKFAVNINYDIYETPLTKMGIM